MRALSNPVVCPLCASAQTREIADVRDSYHYLPGTWRLFHCGACKAGFLADAPDEDHIGAYYPASAYYTHAAPRPDNRVMAAIYAYHYGRRRDFGAALLHALLGRFVNMFPRARSQGTTRLLDFGCGNGALMQRYAAYGFECEGFDVDENAVANIRDRGFAVYSGDWRALPARQYDVIILNQVLEHLHRPIEVLRFLRERLAPGGQLIVSVPNRDCLDYDLLLDSWSSFQAPTHLFHYRLESLRPLLRQAGFRIEEVRYASPLGTLKPGYIRHNVRNLVRMEGQSVRTRLRGLLFAASSLLALVPGISARKRIRITACCVSDAART
ncbi:MAG: class I SAM-dependent methyltransferase [Hydrogenophilales bacterium]|nr:class I SAM-dependent methyltransferase [Hydrogenophilales bacterium]